MEIFLPANDDSFIRPEIFPNLLPLIARHFKTLRQVAMTIPHCLWRSLTSKMTKLYLRNSLWQYFLDTKRKIFKKIAVRTKRFECLRSEFWKNVSFNPNAEVELLPN
jgi:hypothetical protein